MPRPCFPRKPSAEPQVAKRQYTVPDWCVDKQQIDLLIRVRQLENFDSIPDEEVVAFLKSLRFDHRATILALEEHLLWVEKFQPSAIELDHVVGPISSGSLRMLGWDRQGRPVIWGQARYYNNTYGFSPDDSTRAVIWILRQVKALARDGAREIVLVNDISNFAHSSGHTKAFIDTLQNHLPGYVGLSLIVGASWFFHQIWRIIKPWLHEEARAVTRFISDAERLDVLQSIMDVDIIPEMYGGKANPPCPNIPGIENFSEPITMPMPMPSSAEQ